MNTSTIFRSGLLVAVVLLAACGGSGGGGGGGDNNPNPPDPPNPVPVDVTPDTFSLKDVTNAEPDTYYTATMTVAGVDGSVKARVCCTDSAPVEFSTDGGKTWRTDPADVGNGDEVTIRLKSSDKPDSSVNGTLYVGGTSSSPDAEGTVSDNFQVVTKPDITAPELVVQFPPPASMTDIPLPGTLTLRGTVGDDVAISRVHVNGQRATIVPESDVWSFSYSIQPGNNLIEVLAEDAHGNTSSRVLSLIHVDDRTAVAFGTGAVLPNNVESVLWDYERDVLIIGAGQLLVLNLETSERVPIPGASAGKYGLLLDEENNRYLGASYSASPDGNGVFVVNPDTGSTTPLSTKADGGPTTYFHLVNDLAVTADGGRLFAHVWTGTTVADALLWEIDSDPVSTTYGTRSIFSEEEFTKDAGLAMDFTRNRLLIGDCDLKGLPLDAETGDDSSVVIPVGEDFCIQELTVVGRHALARHVLPGEDKILEIDLEENAYRLISDLKDPSDGPTMSAESSRGYKLAIDADKQVLFHFLRGNAAVPAAIVVIDRVTGERVIVAQDAVQ